MKNLQSFCLYGIALFFLVSVRYGLAQTIDTTSIVWTLDCKETEAGMDIISSFAACGEDVVIVLVRSHGMELVKTIEAELEKLIAEGYIQLGMVIGNMKENKYPAVVIFVDSTIYAVIKKAGTDPDVGWKTYNLVRDAYQEFVWPKIKPSQEKN